MSQNSFNVSLQVFEIHEHKHQNVKKNIGFRTI